MQQPRGGLCTAMLLPAVLFWCHAPAGAETGWPLYYRGENVPAAVMTVQYLLRAHGYGLSVDGLFGAETQRVLRRFQRAHGVVPDGRTTAATWPKLIVRLRRGGRGYAVKAVQVQLRRLGYRMPVDGVFGSMTGAAVRSFQRRCGITVDGVVGPVTWRQLAWQVARSYNSPDD